MFPICVPSVPTFLNVSKSLWVQPSSIAADAISRALVALMKPHITSLINNAASIEWSASEEVAADPDCSLIPAMSDAWFMITAVLQASDGVSLRFRFDIGKMVHANYDCGSLTP